MEKSSFLLLLEEGRKLSSGKRNKKEKNHLYLSPSAAEELETVLKQHLLFPLLLPMEESSLLLLLEEGRKLSSGETNKIEKHHLYLSPSASEELETVLKQHLLFPLLLSKQRTHNLFNFRVDSRALFETSLSSHTQVPFDDVTRERFLNAKSTGGTNSHRVDKPDRPDSIPLSNTTTALYHLKWLILYR
jgi:hypothetical protein